MSSVNSILKALARTAAKLDKLAKSKVDEAKRYRTHIRWYDDKTDAAIAEAARAANVAIQLKDLIGG